MHVQRAALVEEAPIATNDNNSDNDNNEAPIEATPSPPARNITMVKESFWSQGQCFEFMLPSDHRTYHVSDVKRWQNGCDVADRVKSKFRRKLYRTNCLFSQALWSIATSAAPALALSAAQWLFPLIVLAFLCDTGIFEDGVPFDTFPKSFPSDATLQNYTVNQAVRETISLSKLLINIPIYTACDKGNKKGVSHFVKFLCWWNWYRGKAQTQVLDIGASGGTTAECADAIEASMNKLKVNKGDPTHLLHGQGTDSGGGGVLDGLADALQARNNLCVPIEDYLVANCCIHALQLQLRNAVVAVFGEGGLEKINVMQMLHSVYDLQEAIDPEEWRHMLWKSSVFVYNFDAAAVITNEAALDNMLAIDRNRNTFYQSYANVLSYHSKFKKEAPVHPDTLAECKGTVYSKMTAPILTRWWTVGAGCLYVFDYYLQIYHVCQSIINVYASDSKANRIASGLYSLMSNVVNFIDMTLIRSFSHAHIHPHLRWLQECVDFTNKYGFQSHNVVVRYYLMSREMRSLPSSRMADYFEAIRGHDPDNVHFKKLDLFMRASTESLHKHFMRWLSPKLLPAAMISEPGIAKVVAAIILKTAMPTAETFGASTVHDASNQRHYFDSEAHSQRIDLNKFDRFVRDAIDDNQECSPLALQAADGLLRGVDLRNKDCSEGSDHRPLRMQLHYKHCSLPSQTQFVESGVKDAKNVSATDRSEHVRTCMSVIRSATPLTKTKEEANANKIRAIIVSTAERINPHIRESAADEYKQRFKKVEALMTKKGHFKQERTAQKTVQFDSTASKHKKPNVNQQAKAQQQTPAVTGLIPYGKLVKSRNMEDLKTELLHRGVAADKVPKSITDRKNMLKELELKRLKDAGIDVTAAKAQADKHFQKQSAAPFKLTDG